MLFSVLEARFRAGRSERVQDEASSYWEERRFRLRRLLEGGRWSIHDVVNRPEVRAAVREQWRLGHIMDEGRAVDGYIGYLEYLEAVSAGEVPAPRRGRPSFFSL